ncbi:MAG: hypothetical protein ACRDRP_20500 [Pseudonocardiaceae bacterium]
MICPAYLDYSGEADSGNQKIRQGAKLAGVEFEMYELTRHSGVRCGTVSTTVPRHNEIPEELATEISSSYLKQLSPALGPRWWTK